MFIVFLFVNYTLPAKSADYNHALGEHLQLDAGPLVYIVTCAKGSWYGNRIEYSGLTYEHMKKNKEKGYFSTMEDRYSSPSVKYIIPTYYSPTSNSGVFHENRNSMGVYVYGELKPRMMFVVNRYNHPIQGENISVVYNIKNLAYLDTIFINSGLVYGSLHKTNARIQVAATYKNKCTVSGPMLLPSATENYHAIKQFLMAE